MNGLLIGFLSGVVVSAVGAILADILARKRERLRWVDQRRFDIYMKLIELNGSYFWFRVAEEHRQSVRPEVRQRCYALAWQISDMLRSADEMEFLEEILDVTLGSSFSTARARHEAMGALLNRMGQRVNPRYGKRMHEISEASLAALGSGKESNAPGAFSQE
jgi:hypothetical protein